EEVTHELLRIGLEAGKQRLGEGRVVAMRAVGGELAGQGGVGNEQRLVRRRDAAEAAETAAGDRRALRALRERVVAAGVEEHDLLRRRAERLEQLVRLDRAERLLAVAVHLHAGRRDRLRAGELHAVAGVVAEGNRRLGSSL